MRIGVLRVYFSILSAASLKEKRMVMRSLKDRLASRFNVSVAEIGSNDEWKLGECVVDDDCDSGQACIGGQFSITGTDYDAAGIFAGAK